MRWLLMTVALWTAALSAHSSPRALETRTTWWPDGQVRSTGSYVRDVRDGEFLSWYANGQLADIRHYIEGREVGRQQSWTAEGVLFLNYDVRDGRRFGLVNSKPCLPADEQAEADAAAGGM